MPPRSLLLIAFLSTLLSSGGCSEQPDLIIISRELKSESLTISGLPKELSSLGSPAKGYNYWVEGVIENQGNADAERVTLVFEADDGVQTLTLIADVGSVPRGASVPFKTRFLPSVYEITLLNEQTDIRYR
jgi:hypothetical protein